MIKLKQPSLVLHSNDVPGYRYNMWQGWVMPKKATASDVVYWILYAWNQTPELWLRNVVINCHGNDGFLAVGGDGEQGINIDNVGVFKELFGKGIGAIWLVACLVASSAKGERFCQKLAQTAGCSVVAADKEQTGVIWCPWGWVDNFEGHTYEWDGAGHKSPVDQDGSGIPGVDED